MLIFGLTLLKSYRGRHRITAIEGHNLAILIVRDGACTAAILEIHTRADGQTDRRNLLRVSPSQMNSGFGE